MDTTTISAKKYNDKSKNAIALVGEFTIHFAIRNGHVYNVSNASVFNTSVPNSISFEFEMPNDNIEITKLQSWSNRNIEIQNEQKIHWELQKVEAYKKRKQDIINLWKWRHNETGAYVVNTYEQCTEYSDNSSPVECKIFFDETEANEYFESVKNTSPDGAFGNSGWSFITELYQLSDYDDALEIMDMEDLTKVIFERGNMTNSESYADPIPDGHIIVDVYQRQHGGAHQYTGCSTPRTSSFWAGSSHYSSQKTYADLACFQDSSPNRWQVTMSIYDAVEQYGCRVVTDLGLSKDEAIEAGLDESTIEECFAEEESETEE